MTTLVLSVAETKFFILFCQNIKEKIKFTEETELAMLVEQLIIYTLYFYVFFGK